MNAWMSKNYEEELKSNYVHNKKIGELEGKIQVLEVELESLKEQLKSAIEAGQTPRQMEEERHLSNRSSYAKCESKFVQVTHHIH